MPAVRADLVEREADRGRLLDGNRDPGMPQAMTKQVEADSLTELAARATDAGKLSRKPRRIALQFWPDFGRF